MGQTDPKFHCICVGPPCRDLPCWKRGQGPGPSKRWLCFIHNYQRVQNIKFNGFVWWWIFTFFKRYFHLSEITTTTRNIISIFNTVRWWIDISTLDRLRWMTYSFISVIYICIYFINVFFSFSLYLDHIFLNVIFPKLISNFLYVFISIYLIYSAS